MFLKSTVSSFTIKFGWRVRLVPYMELALTCAAQVMNHALADVLVAIVIPQLLSTAGQQRRTKLAQ